MRNNNVLPTDLPQLTNKHLDSINLSSNGIVKIISHLDLNKAQGHDMLGIWVINLWKLNLQTSFNNFQFVEMRINFIMNGKI